MWEKVKKWIRRIFNTIAFYVNKQLAVCREWECQEGGAVSALTQMPGGTSLPPSQAPWNCLRLCGAWLLFIREFHQVEAWMENALFLVKDSQISPGPGTSSKP